METIQGVRTKLGLVSFSHGAIRIPLAQNFNYTPSITQRTISEFDNLEAAQVVTTFDGVDLTFDYLDSDSKLVEAMFADVDPASAVVHDDPSNYKQVYIFANVKGLTDGLIFASILAKGCKTKGAPYSEPVKEEASITRDLSGTNVIKFKGSAIYYQRILADTPAVGVYEQAVPPNMNLDLNFAAISPYAATLVETAINCPYTGTYYAVVLKNGVEVTTGFTMTATTFTVAAAPATTDIWEVFYLYADV